MDSTVMRRILAILRIGSASMIDHSVEFAGCCGWPLKTNSPVLRKTTMMLLRMLWQGPVQQMHHTHPSSFCLLPKHCQPQHLLRHRCGRPLYLPCSSISRHKLQRAKMPCCVQGSCVDLNTQCTSNLHGMLSDDGKHAPL